MTPRVVLDTNVVVSALVFQHGRLTWLRAAWTSGRFLPLISAATLQELLRVLAYPKLRLTSDDITALLAEYVPFAQVVEMPDARVPVPDPPDPDDRMFLELGLRGEAGYLVTGDRPLRRRSAVGACRIVTPEEFRQALEGGQQGI